MPVSIDKLFTIIGNLTVQNQLLIDQANDLRSEIVAKSQEFEALQVAIADQKKALTQAAS